MDITCYLEECVRNNTPVSFSKYGDGEYLCATGHAGQNCDNDNYTEKKGVALKDSIQYMVNHSPNAFIGRCWFAPHILDYWQSLVSKPIQWALFHTIIFDGNDDDAKVNLFKSIKENNKLVKIIICNQKIAKTKRLLDLDHVVIVPFVAWFDTDFENYLSQVVSLIHKDGRNPLVITSCGMSAKVMICELSKRFPKGIYLDFGSALDNICTKGEITRAGQRSYEYMADKLKDILPADWLTYDVQPTSVIVENPEVTNSTSVIVENPEVTNSTRKAKRITSCKQPPPKQMPLRLQKYLLKKK